MAKAGRPTKGVESATKVLLHQVVYSPETARDLEAGYLALDNLANERPDWFEYWPIRRFLLTETLDEKAFYGFFSPKFFSKTGLDHAAVVDFVRKNAARADVVLFSPQADMGAFFLNVFEQAETFDAGMIATYEALLARIGRETSLSGMVMDSRTVVYSNYFVARPAFWRAWLAVNEALFAIAETEDDALGRELRHATAYSATAQRKVFLQERTASFLLAAEPQWRSVRYVPFRLSWSASALNTRPIEAVISDALKTAYIAYGDHEYLTAFGSVRDKLRTPAAEAPAPVAPDGAATDLPAGPMMLSDAIVAAEKAVGEGRPGDAEAVYRSYLAAPGDGLIYAGLFNLGTLLRTLGRNVEAEAFLRHCVQMKPDFLRGHLNLGILLEGVGRRREAIESWNAGAEHARGEAGQDREARLQLLNNAGRLSEIERDYAGAERFLTESLDVEPTQTAVQHHWIHLRQKQCVWPVLGGRIEEEALANVASPLAILSLSDDPAVQLACAARYVREKVRPFERMVPADRRYGHDRIRIGYLSSDLSMHAVSLLTVQLFEKHDRSKVEVHAFCWSKEDGTPFRARVRAAFDHFHPIGGMTDEAAARLIADREIDVLVDLQGLSGNARPEIVARGPAPIQIAWLGYPGTSAIPHVDYVVADDFIFPPELEPFFSEKPLRLPTTFQVSDTGREFGPERPRAFYGLPDDAFVFCAFNNNYKIAPEMFAAWLRILGRSPNAVLWLLEDNVWSRANLSARAQAEGVDPARIFFAGRIDPKDYLSRFRTADLFLDTSPYNAGTTANDALWAGLPLITLPGRSYVSRMAGSLSKAAGLSELICRDAEHYENLAVELSTDPQRLKNIRLHLDQRKSAGALFNTDNFRDEFEDALQRLIAC